MFTFEAFHILETQRSIWCISCVAPKACFYWFVSAVGPRIDKSGLRDQKVRAGQPISLNVRFTGEPAPKPEWTLNKNILRSSDR